MPFEQSAHVESSYDSTPTENYWTALNNFTDQFCTTEQGCTFSAVRVNSSISTDTEMDPSPQDNRYKIINAYSMESDELLDLENANPNLNQRVVIDQKALVPENWFELELSEVPDFTQDNTEWQARKNKSKPGNEIAARLLDEGKTKISAIVKENGLLSAGVITKGSVHNFYGVSYIATFTDNQIKHPNQPPSYTLSFFHSEDVELYYPGYVKVKSKNLQNHPHISFSGKNISENSFHITEANGNKYYFDFFGTLQRTSSPKNVVVPSEVEYLKNYVITEMKICN